MVDKPWFQTVLRLILGAQLVVVRLSHAWHRVTRRGARSRGYVVGMEEIAGLLTAIAGSLDDVTTVNLATNPLYDQHYDIEFDLRGRRSLYQRLRRLVVGPWVMGRLVAQRRTFLYLGAEGFLVSLVDGRDRELGYLRAQGRVVICYFAGSEIRSQPLMNAFGAKLGRDVLTTYEPLVSPGIASEGADQHRRRLAAAADRHAQLIFNVAVDQMSYFTRPTEAPLYFYPDERISRRPAKWEDVTRPVVVHAPTSPVIKGTPLVRAAVKALAEHGYDFEYVELTNQPNDEVLATLERAHIVLNQFYALIPGVFGVEAMAANAVLLTSADAGLETSLPPGANDAWVVTPYWEIQDKLKWALDHRDELQARADAGTDWVLRHCSRSVNQARLHALLAAVESSPT